VIVGTEVGGVPELLNYGKAGLLVPPMDVKALGDALITVLTDPQKAANLSRGATEDLDRFRLEHMIRNVDMVYSELVARPRVMTAGAAPTS